MEEKYHYLLRLNYSKQDTATVIILGMIILGSFLAFKNDVSGQEFEDYLDYEIYVPEYEYFYIEGSEDNVSIGEKITFSGQILLENEPEGYISIAIMDETKNEVIVEGYSDYEGFYFMDWYPEESGFYEIYARTPSDLELEVISISNTIFVNVEELELLPPPPIIEEEIELVLEPLPEKIPEGEFFMIKGYVTSQEFTGNRVFIKIDNLLETTDKINPEGEFSKNWSVTSDFVGIMEISAECPCDGYYLHSKVQKVIVEREQIPTPPPIPQPEEPLEIQIATNLKSGFAPLEIKIQADVTGGDYPYDYFWDLGDDTYASTKNLSKKYEKGGDYPVRLTVTDTNGKIAKSSTLITIKEKLSEPEILISNEREEGEQIKFASKVEDPNNIISYKWNLSDGRDYSGKTISHIFRDNGSYEIELIVKSLDGQIATKKETIEISNIAPKIVDLSSNKKEINVDEKIRINASFVDPGLDDSHIAELYVNDKQISVLELSSSTIIQEQTFEKAGDYTITLVVKDNDGGEHKGKTTLKVNESPWMLVGIGVAAVAGGTGFAAKTMLVSKPRPQRMDVIENTYSDAMHNNENSTNKEVPKQMPGIDIEVSWGFEK